MNAPTYVPNTPIQHDILISRITPDIATHAAKYLKKLQHYSNQDVNKLIEHENNLVRRLKRSIPTDLVERFKDSM